MKVSCPNKTIGGFRGVTVHYPPWVKLGGGVYPPGFLQIISYLKYSFHSFFYVNNKVYLKVTTLRYIKISIISLNPSSIKYIRTFLSTRHISGICALIKKRPWYIDHWKFKTKTLWYKYCQLNAVLSPVWQFILWTIFGIFYMNAKWIIYMFTF